MNNKVKPSGGERKTLSAPRLPPAPARFSTRTGWPHLADSFSPSRRASASVAEPGANGTTILTGRPGYSCAWAVPPGASANAAASHSARNKSSFMTLPPFVV